MILPCALAAAPLRSDARTRAMRAVTALVQVVEQVALIQAPPGAA